MLSAPKQMSSAALATRLAYLGAKSVANIRLNAAWAVAPLFRAPMVILVYRASTWRPPRGNQMDEAMELRSARMKLWYWPLASSDT